VFLGAFLNQREAPLDAGILSPSIVYSHYARLPSQRHSNYRLPSGRVIRRCHELAAGPLPEYREAGFFVFG